MVLVLETELMVPVELVVDSFFEHQALLVVVPVVVDQILLTVLYLP